MTLPSESYQALRQGRVWRLLGADLGPLVMAMLQHLLLEEDKKLPQSVLQERLARALEVLRGRGHSLPQTAQAYISDWLAEGWLTRRLPPGAAEEEYELTADAVKALSFVGTLLKPRSAATESRLASVTEQVLRLAEETDANPERRRATLVAERDRINAELAALDKGGMRLLADDRAVERAREIILLALDLALDFRNVRDAFDRLNRDLRQSLMENDGSRGEVLEHLFSGVDVIGESEAGKTFSAFWRLLTDGEQSSALTEALDAITSRTFAQHLDARERKFLRDLTATLMLEGGGVHEVFQQFARSLKSFVQSKEFREQRRLHSLLKQAQQAALTAKQDIRPNETLGYELTLTSSRIRSVSQWTLYDPSLRIPDETMAAAAQSDIDLDRIEALVRESEIDFRTLEEHLAAMLAEVSQATVGDLLRRFPAEQGFGSVVGYVALGVRRGEVTQSVEQVRWVGQDGVRRSARIPAIYFVSERAVEQYV